MDKYQIKKSKITALQWNARSAVINKTDICFMLTNFDIDLAAICETWIKPHYSFNIPGYQCIRCDRQEGRGGGSWFLFDF
jgi:hypothetical protein